ncbi:DUF2489 domain-containing protein [bacterium SCSIO 12696]|nr:DUF2489 domain-containing protein [bacterium SCSIO 12696]
MSEVIWVFIAAVIVLALGGYALYLAVALRKRERQRALWRDEVEQMVRERSENIHNSIRVIAGAMLEQQMTMSECVIRLSGLLNQLGPVGENSRYQSLHLAAAELAHIPILDDWKALKFREQMKHLKEMDAVEQKYGDFVLDVCRHIQQVGITEESAQQEQSSVGYYMPNKPAGG